jgi:hypothetical protein
MREVLLQLLREVCLPLLQPTAKPAVQQVPKEHKSGLAGTAVMQRTVHRRPLRPGAPNSAQSAVFRWTIPSAEAIQQRPWWLSFHAGHCYACARRTDAFCAASVRARSHGLTEGRALHRTARSVVQYVPGHSAHH